MMELVRCKNREEAKSFAAQKLNQLFLAHQHVPVLFLSSGGSALELFEGIDKACLPKNFQVGVLDERVGVEPKNTNSARLKGAPIFSRYQFQEQVFPTARKIIITQGVGADGHTAGIFPFFEDPKKFQELFENREVPWVTYSAGVASEYPERATVTLSFLRKVDHSVVYMVGEEKRNALERVLAKEGAIHETPSRIVHEMKDVTIFTDIL